MDNGIKQGPCETRTYAPKGIVLGYLLRRTQGRIDFVVSSCGSSDPSFSYCGDSPEMAKSFPSAIAARAALNKRCEAFPCLAAGELLRGAKWDIIRRTRHEVRACTETVLSSFYSYNKEI